MPKKEIVANSNMTFKRLLRVLNSKPEFEVLLELFNLVRCRMKIGKYVPALFCFPVKFCTNKGRSFVPEGLNPKVDCFNLFHCSENSDLGVFETFLRFATFFKVEDNRRISLGSGDFKISLEYVSPKMTELNRMMLIAKFDLTSDHSVNGLDHLKWRSALVKPETFNFLRFSTLSPSALQNILNDSNSPSTTIKDQSPKTFPRPDSLIDFAVLMTETALLIEALFRLVAFPVDTCVNSELNQNLLILPKKKIGSYFNVQPAFLDVEKMSSSFPQVESTRTVSLCQFLQLCPEFLPPQFRLNFIIWPESSYDDRWCIWLNTGVLGELPDNGKVLHVRSLDFPNDPDEGKLSLHGDLRY
jgi:hypothetical protein